MQESPATHELPERIISRFRQSGFDGFMTELGSELDLTADESNTLRATIESFLAEQVIASEIVRTERALGALKTQQQDLRTQFRRGGVTTNRAARPATRRPKKAQRASRRATTGATTRVSRRSSVEVERVLAKLPKRFGRDDLVRVVGSRRARTVPAHLARRGLIRNLGNGWYEKQAAAGGKR